MPLGNFVESNLTRSKRPAFLLSITSNLEGVGALLHRTEECTRFLRSLVFEGVVQRTVLSTKPHSA